MSPFHAGHIGREPGSVGVEFSGDCLESFGQKSSCQKILTLPPEILLDQSICDGIFATVTYLCVQATRISYVAIQDRLAGYRCHVDR